MTKKEIEYFASLINDYLNGDDQIEPLTLLASEIIKIIREKSPDIWEKIRKKDEQ